MRIDGDSVSSFNGAGVHRQRGRFLSRRQQLLQGCISRVGCFLPIGAMAVTIEPALPYDAPPPLTIDKSKTSPCVVRTIGQPGAELDTAFIGRVPFDAV